MKHQLALAVAAALPLLQWLTPPTGSGSDFARRARETHQRMQDAAPWARRHRIPLGLAVTIARQADRHRIPRPLAFRLVRTESAFDSLALNPRSRACGLTQLLPATARTWRPRLPLRQLCWRPELNLDAGFSYLAMLQRRYGDWWVSTSAYYLGPGTVDSVPTKVLDTLSYTGRIVVM